MQKREPLLTEQHFDKAIQRQERMIRETEEDVLLPPGEVVMHVAYLVLFRALRKSLVLKYSRGYPLDELKQLFPAVVVALEGCRYHPDPQGGDLFFNGEQDEYMQAVALLSLGLLLRVEAGVFQRLVAALGLNGQDFVLEWLAGRRLPDRPQPTQLLFPKTYARLRDAIQAPRDIQAVVLRGFLSSWYESLDTVWYNIHAHRADAAGFTGYWCWEAAAVACFLGVDDGELRALRYYPADLADYALGRQPAPPTA
ncbi:MAG TPA: PoNe immunity protein domain-containing protein [Hymenobacter sp.]|jgi:hypothetical protein